MEQSLDIPVSPAEPDDSLRPLPILHHEVLEAQQEQGLFQLEPNTVNQMESLLERTLGLQNHMETEATTSNSQKAQRFEPPMTRSKEKKIKWNPTMNSDPVVLLDSDSDT